jgi:Uma2 family endonuclease
MLDEYVRIRNLGAVGVAPSPIRVSAGKLREPDIFFVTPRRVSSTRQPPDGADLVIEVVSEGDSNRDRDLVGKRQEYARAGIPEYWIVDPIVKTICVLGLAAGQIEYEVLGEYGIGTRATSRMLADFAVDVAATFAAGDGTLERDIGPASLSGDQG